MLNQDKIRLMSRLAMYEKNRGKEDRNRMGFFKNDYVAYHCFTVQIGVTVALLIVFSFDFAIQVLDNLARITEFDFVAPMVRYFTVWALFMVAYTVIAAFYNRIEYLSAEKRVNTYQKQLKQLEKLD